jgi:hypothetical protein
MKLTKNHSLKISVVEATKIIRDKKKIYDSLKRSLQDKNYVRRGKYIYIQPPFSVSKKLIKKGNKV